MRTVLPFLIAMLLWACPWSASRPAAAAAPAPPATVLARDVASGVAAELRGPVVVVVRGYGQLPNWFREVGFEAALLRALPSGSRAPRPDETLVNTGAAEAERERLIQAGYSAVVMVELYPTPGRVDASWKAWLPSGNETPVRMVSIRPQQDIRETPIPHAAYGWRAEAGKVGGPIYFAVQERSPPSARPYTMSVVVNSRVVGVATMLPSKSSRGVWVAEWRTGGRTLYRYLQVDGGSALQGRLVLQDEEGTTLATRTFTAETYRFFESSTGTRVPEPRRPYGSPPAVGALLLAGGIMAAGSGTAMFVSYEGTAVGAKRSGALALAGWGATVAGVSILSRGAGATAWRRYRQDRRAYLQGDIVAPSAFATTRISLSIE